MSPALFCASRIYYAIYNFIAWAMSPYPPQNKISYYILSDEYDHDEVESLEKVPEDSVVIEEWEKNRVKKCNLFYEGEDIVKGVFDPFLDEPEVPWIWIGDKKTEVDLTSAMQKYMVVGNTIHLDLLLQLIQVNKDTELVYVDARTLDEVKFPASGVRILAKNGSTQ